MIGLCSFVRLKICADIGEFGRNKDPNLRHPQEHFKCDTFLKTFFPCPRITSHMLHQFFQHTSRDTAGISGRRRKR